MSKKANHNSIIFLTTLSVYLGLVLVGGAAPVLAHSALTRGFDIKNEIIFEDDLDKKPDDDEIEFSGPRGDYFDDLKSFIEDLRKLNQIEKFNPNFDTFYTNETQIFECNLANIRRSISLNPNFRVDNNWLLPAIDDLRNDLENYAFYGDCLPQNDLQGKEGTNYGLKLTYDKTDLKFELSITKESSQKAKQLLDRLNQAYKIYELDEEEIIVKEIYLNTIFSIENNQVFIVTRLPRGSIDALLADKDAQ